MPKVTLIVGLPGSGKTHLAHDIRKRSIELRPTIVFDDMKAPDLPKAEDAVKKGKDLIITDPWLCYREFLTKAKQLASEKWGASDVDVIYFENNPEACLRNVKFRDDGRNVESFIRHATKHYEIPEGTIRCRVWDPAIDGKPNAPDRWIRNGT